MEGFMKGMTWLADRTGAAGRRMRIRHYPGRPKATLAAAVILNE